MGTNIYCLNVSNKFLFTSLKEQKTARKLRKYKKSNENETPKGGKTLINMHVIQYNWTIWNISICQCAWKVDNIWEQCAMLWNI